MPSAITVIPPDGSNAVKANFRSNFTSAKAESEHGGFFTQKGALASFTGQVERQSEQRLNDLSISVKDYGAVGDETSRPVSQWLTGGARDRGYANLAAIQVHYPHVISLSDEIDWAAIQKAIFVSTQVGTSASCRVVIPAGIYYCNKTVQVDRHVELTGEGMAQSVLKWTAAHTSGPCIQIKPSPSHVTTYFIAVHDLTIDGIAVLTTNLTNHGIEFYNAINAQVWRVNITQVKGCGILMWNGVYFCLVENIFIDRTHDSMICLRNGIVGGADGFGDPTQVANGNHFHDLFLFAQYHSPVTTHRPRLLEIFPGCAGNYFSDIEVQTGVYRMDDCWIYLGGNTTMLQNFIPYDGPGVSRTCTTSSGAGGVVRMTFNGMPNLVTGDRITATGITGITSGTLYAVTSVSDSETIFDVTGTTYSGSPQTGRIVRGGNITATAAGGSSRIQVTSAEHNLYTGQKIVVAGITGGTGTQSVIRLDRNTFQLAGTTFGGSTQTGTWTIDRPTSFIQFGEPYAGFGAAGWNSAITNVQVVCNHDSATDTYAMLFLGTAQNSRIHNVINDQGGPLRPYLVENGAKFHYFTDWYLPSLPGGTDRLYQFRGFGIDYTPRLMAQDFGSSVPVLANLDDGQIAFGAVGTGANDGRLYYRKGAGIFVFNSSARTTA